MVIVFVLITAIASAVRSSRNWQIPGLNAAILSDDGWDGCELSAILVGKILNAKNANEKCEECEDLRKWAQRETGYLPALWLGKQYVVSSYTRIS